MRNWRPALGLASIAACAAFAAPASADDSLGGVAYEAAPSVASASCASAKAGSCRPQDQLVVKGRDLATVTTVEFLGGPGSSDDRRARPDVATARRLVVVVPKSAKSGPVRARTAAATVRLPKALRIVDRSPAALTPASVAGPQLFPIRGEHDMGQSATNRFGGARNHGGQDVFAECGTPLVAVTDAVVQKAAFQSRAGNYVVLQGADGRSYAYMHMRAPARVAQGDEVAVGEQVGEVGETGRATGCHLHFELWTAPGWYTGGKAIDPLPLLRQLEAAEHAHA